MSNLMDKISNKLGKNNDNDGPSSNTRSSQRNQQGDDSFSTQDQYGDDQYGNQQGMGQQGMNQQGYQQRPQDSDAGFNQGSQGDFNQSGTKDQSYGMYDQDDPQMSSGRKQTGTQQGYGTTSQSGMDSGMGQDLGNSGTDQFDDGQQQQFQRRY